MRYYEITITNPTTGAVIRPAQFAPLNLPSSYSSYVNGQTLPGALNIELDVFVSSYANPDSGSYVHIDGVSLPEISQANNLFGMNIEVKGGMKAGLPLANPAHSGILFQGNIFQAFGNWVGTEMSLDLIINAGTNVPNNPPPNLVHNWAKGTKLADAIKTTLKTAFPTYTANVSISDNLIYTENSVGFYTSLEQYALYIKQVSTSIIAPASAAPSATPYQGVEIALNQTTFSVHDGTTQTTPKSISFQDLVGQPTWIEGPVIQVKTVMRADINVGDYIKLPPGLVTTSSAVPNSQVDLKTAFQGTFLVTKLRHVGNFRQPDGASWVTIILAAPVAQGTSGQ